MSVRPVVAVQADGVRSPVSRARLAAAGTLVLRAQKAHTALLSITLLGARGMAALNRKHLGHAGPTDVISFGFRDPQGAVIGDIYLCPEVAARNARAHGVGVREELLRLVVHGTLHVLGHDHPDGEARVRSPMWRTQERLLARVLGA
jgi:probable rRNA maturation factor